MCERLDDRIERLCERDALQQRVESCEEIAQAGHLQTYEVSHEESREEAGEDSQGVSRGESPCQAEDEGSVAEAEDEGSLEARCDG